jgi:DNA-binding response OmpR family regulator
VISGAATISETVEALRLGVFDFIEKPFSRERLRTAVRNALSRASLEGEVDALRAALGEGELVGRSSAMVALRDRIAAVAPTDATVLVRRGRTGKELVARSPPADRRSKGRSSGQLRPSLPGGGRALRPRARAFYRPGRRSRPLREAHGGTLLLARSGTWSRPAVAACCGSSGGKVRRSATPVEAAVDVR